MNTSKVADRQPSNFEEILKQKRGVVWSEISGYFNRVFIPDINRFSKGYKSIGRFHQNLVMEYPKRKGKYLRPTLVLLTAVAMGVEEKKALKTATAMQISEDWILNHDDWEDGSLERRGRPTLHRIYGPELAVNAGDALHILMWKVLKDNAEIVGPELASKVTEEFYQILIRTTLGQTAEIKWTQENRTDLLDNDWFFIADGKTAYYTISGPMRLGAILANATDRQLQLILKFGTSLGRCFQIQDDILDLTSDFRGLKKQQGNDIYEGKRTLILIHLLQNANLKDKKRIEAIMKKPRDQKTQADVLKVLDMMHFYKSIKYAKDVAEKLAQDANKIFKEELNFLDHEPARNQLQAGINFILYRDY